MDRLKKHNQCDSMIVSPVKYGTQDSVPIDQQSSQPFNIDPDTGRPINDITVVLRAQDKFEQQRVLSSMETFKSDYLSEDVSNEDAIKYAFPRYSQLPSELAEVTERFTQQQLKEAKEKADKKAAKDREDKLKKAYEELSDVKPKD